MRAAACAGRRLPAGRALWQGAAPARAPRRALSGPVPVSPAARAAWDAAQSRRAWWNGLYESGGDVFTLPGLSPTLRAWWPRLSAAGARARAARAPPPAVARVLVPGVGRDASALWLARQPGWGAVGVDVSDVALRALGAAGGGVAPIHEGAAWSAYQVADAPRLLLVHGDAAALTVADYGGPFEAAWDRGALTAVADRAAYARALAAALAPHAAALVEVLATNVRAEGAIDEGEAVAALRGAGLEVEVLQRTDVRAAYPAFRPPGLERLDEVVLLATRGA